MKITSVYTPMKKVYSAVRNSIFRTADRTSFIEGGAEALANQNRILVRPANQIDPERVDFKSTKDMFEYARSKIIDPLKKEKPYEYTVVMNVRTNKVLAEYKGDANNCLMSNLESLPLDSKDVVLMHGHPDSYPISENDVLTLLKYKLNQVIAVDKNGEFSMVARKNNVPSVDVKSKEYTIFKEENMANSDSFYETHNEEMLKRMTHYTLSDCADSLGIRYITNYGYLSKGVN